MLIRQRQGVLRAQFGTSGLAQPGRKQRTTVIVEGYEPAIECGIPERREQKAVVNIEPLGVAGAILPRYDLGGAQQRGVQDAGQGVASLPVLNQPRPEYVLANALYDKPLGLGGPRKLFDLGLNVRSGASGRLAASW
jgi:hypothetical protein